MANRIRREREQRVLNRVRIEKMRLHDAVRYAIYVARSLSHPSTRFGAVEEKAEKRTINRSAEAVVINSALKLVTSILRHGFGAAKGQMPSLIGRAAVSELMGKIMHPVPYDESRPNGNVLLEADIRALWRQMNVKTLKDEVREAIKEILRKFYVGAMLQYAREKSTATQDRDGRGKDQYEKRLAEWNKKETLEKLKFEDEFARAYGELVSEGTLAQRKKGGNRADGAKRARKPKASAMKIERLDSYYDALADIASTVEPGSTVYVSKDTGLGGEDICGKLSQHLPAYFLHCKSHDADTIDPYSDVSKKHSRTVFVVEGYEDVEKYTECCRYWNDFVVKQHKAPRAWVYVAVADATTDAQAAGMVKISSAVVGLEGAEKIGGSKKMVGDPKCVTQIESDPKPVLRTYSDDLKFYNAPFLGGSPSSYMDCGVANLRVFVDGQERDEKHSMFVLRVSSLSESAWKNDLGIMLKLACQQNVCLVTTKEQHDAIVELRRERENDASRETETKPADAGGTSKKKRKEQTGDGTERKKRGARGDKKGKKVAVRRVTTYYEALWAMLAEALYDSIIYVNPTGHWEGKKAATADTICAYLAREFNSLVIMSTGYENESAPGTFTEYAADNTAALKKNTLAVKKEHAKRSVLLVVDGDKTAAGVTGCIAHVRRLLQWPGTDSVSWNTIVVGSGHPDGGETLASLAVGSMGRSFQEAKSEGGVVATAATEESSSGETETELRTFSENLMLTNLPRLTPIVNERNTVLGDLSTYVGSAYVALDVIRNGVQRKEDAAVFVLRVPLLRDWDKNLDVLVKLAMQKNVMLVTNENQHNAIVERFNQDANKVDKQAQPVHESGSGQRATKPASPTNGSPQGASAGRGLAPSLAEENRVEGAVEEVHWDGPVTIMGKQWMYAEVEKAGCGESWRDLKVERKNVTIKFLQVKPHGTQPPNKGTQNTHAKGDGAFLYIACDKDRIITGEYVRGKGKSKKRGTWALANDTEVATKLDEFVAEYANTQNGRAPVVYILCEAGEGLSNGPERSEGGTQKKAMTPAKAMHGGGTGIEVPWVSDSGTWQLWAQGRNEGTYDFDRNAMTIMSSYSGTQPKKSRVVITRCDALASQLKAASSFKTMHKIVVERGSVVREMQTKGARHKVFVLPSQLNAAEYPNHHSIVGQVAEYVGDPTGGPAAQLAGDLGVAQFIIDNASNETRRDKGIDNTRLMGQIKGIRVVNGYLQVDRDADVETFEKMLPEMTILGVRDVPVRGLDEERQKFVVKDHTVDLIYASAVPFGSFTNPERHDAVKKVANLTLLAQYTGAMRLAIQRGKCDLYLMPLGGGVFDNPRPEIRAAIRSAREVMKDELKSADVKMVLLAYEHSKDKEYEFFANKDK